MWWHGIKTLLGQADIDGPSPAYYRQGFEVIEVSLGPLGVWVRKLAAVEGGGHSNMHRQHPAVVPGPAYSHIHRLIHTD